MYIIAWNYITVQSFMFRSAILLVSYAGWNRRCSGRWINKIDISEISLSSLQLEIQLVQTYWLLWCTNITWHIYMLENVRIVVRWLTTVACACIKPGLDSDAMEYPMSSTEGQVLELICGDNTCSWNIWGTSREHHICPYLPNTMHGTGTERPGNVHGHPPMPLPHVPVILCHPQILRHEVETRWVSMDILTS